MRVLHEGLSSKNGFVRKGAAALLAVPKWLRSLHCDRKSLAACPPVLANSFPKSGTHLSVQIIDGLPNRVNYGAFLASMTSSFHFRERSATSTCRFIRGFVPGEVVRGHLFFDPRYAEQLADRHVVHYFVYRDPRDVVVSEAHYLREMNRWHKMAPYFRKLPTNEDAIMLSIEGLKPAVPGIDFPDIAARLERYKGWLSSSDCFAMRFEDLISERRSAIIEQMAEFYARHVSEPLDVSRYATAMAAGIAPTKSHTFRQGKKASWQREFSPAHCERFAEIAGDLLVELGYEPDLKWASAAGDRRLKRLICESSSTTMPGIRSKCS